MTDLFKELERINNIETDAEAFKNELLKVRKQKLDDIYISLITLITINIGMKLYEGDEYPSDAPSDLFKDIPRDIDMESFMEKVKDRYIRNRWNDLRGNGNEYQSGIPISDLFDVAQSPILFEMLSSGYKPPEDLASIIEHIQILGTYYKYIFNVPPKLSDLRLDLSLVKLSRQIEIFGSIQYVSGKRKLPRLKESARKLKSKAERMADHISEIVFRCNKIKSHMKIHAVATIVRKEFEGLMKIGTIQEKRVPCLDTIKKYLRNDERIASHFNWNRK
jgi:hypothetical protein